MTFISNNPSYYGQAGDGVKENILNSRLQIKKEVVFPKENTNRLRISNIGDYWGKFRCQRTNLSEKKKINDILLKNRTIEKLRVNYNKGEHSLSKVSEHVILSETEKVLDLLLPLIHSSVIDIHISSDESVFLFIKYKERNIVIDLFFEKGESTCSPLLNIFENKKNICSFIGDDIQDIIDRLRECLPDNSIQNFCYELS